MKVILLKEKTVRDVADGYARNFLIPRGLAVPATPSAIKGLEKQRQKEAAERNQLLQKFAEAVKKIETLEFRSELKTSKDGRLYGSVTTQKIAAFLAEQGIDVEKSQIELNQPIKTPGEHSVKIKFAPSIGANLRVVVIARREGD